MTDAQLRGMLLEEALLYLLRISGYQPVSLPKPGDPPDETLCLHKAGIGVKGRGGVHQIDAIADFTIAHPFSHPQRLLVEAKCLKKAVGIDTVRNALGVLVDVSEYWVSASGIAPAAKRYHYQYGLFSSSGYSVDAQRFAFAHDIYLIPVARSRFFAPILQQIKILSAARLHQTNLSSQGQMAELRKYIRDALAETQEYRVDQRDPNEMFRGYITAVKRLYGALLAMINNQFPILLVPSPRQSSRLKENQIEYHEFVRIRWNQEGWYLYSNNEQQYSFDLPEELFELYAEDGVLSKTAALDMKGEHMQKIQAYFVSNNTVRIINYQLDQQWLELVREQMRREA